MDSPLFANRTDGFKNDSCAETTITIKSYVLCFVLGAVMIVTSGGNLLVIISILYFRQLQTPTNYLVLSLAVTDLLVGTVVLPFSIFFFVSTCWHAKYMLCIIRGAFDIILCTSSILNLCCISIDRYIAVCYPLSYKNKITADVMVVMIVAVWSLSSVCGIVITFEGQKGKQCVFLKHLKLAMLVPFIGFCILVILMLTIYIRIAYVAEMHLRRIKTQHMKESDSKMERKATYTLMIVMGVFILCWTPFVLCLMAMPLLNFVIPLVAVEILKWLGWLNSMMNVFIYGAFYTWFRSAFRLILTGKIFRGDYTNAKLV